MCGAKHAAHLVYLAAGVFILFVRQKRHCMGKPKQDAKFVQYQVCFVNRHFPVPGVRGFNQMLHKIQRKRVNAVRQGKPHLLRKLVRGQQQRN